MQLSNLWPSEPKASAKEEDFTTILDANPELKLHHTQEEYATFKQIITQEPFLESIRMQEISSLTVPVNIHSASRLGPSRQSGTRLEFLRFFFDGFVIVFFDEKPQYQSMIKRKLKLSQIESVKMIDSEKMRIDFFQREKQFIELSVSDIAIADESLDEEQIQKAGKEALGITDLVEIFSDLIGFVKSVKTMPKEDESDKELNEIKEDGMSCDKSDNLKNKNKSEIGGSKNTKSKNNKSSKSKHLKSASILLKLLNAVSQVDTLANLDKRHSAMYIGRKSQEQIYELMQQQHSKSPQNQKEKSKNETQTDFAQNANKPKNSLSRSRDSRLKNLRLDENEEKLFLRTRQVQKSFKMMSKHFLELDFEIHATLEKENQTLMNIHAKEKKKFLRNAKNLSKILALEDPPKNSIQRESDISKKDLLKLNISIEKINLTSYEEIKEDSMLLDEQQIFRVNNRCYFRKNRFDVLKFWLFFVSEYPINFKEKHFFYNDDFILKYLDLPQLTDYLTLYFYQESDLGHKLKMTILDDELVDVGYITLDHIPGYNFFLQTRDQLHLLSCELASSAQNLIRSLKNLIIYSKVRRRYGIYERFINPRSLLLHFQQFSLEKYAADVMTRFNLRRAVDSVFSNLSLFKDSLFKLKKYLRLLRQSRALHQYTQAFLHRFHEDFSLEMEMFNVQGEVQAQIGFYALLSKYKQILRKYSLEDPNFDEFLGCLNLSIFVRMASQIFSEIHEVKRLLIENFAITNFKTENSLPQARSHSELNPRTQHEDQFTKSAKRYFTNDSESRSRGRTKILKMVSKQDTMKSQNNGKGNESENVIRVDVISPSKRLGDIGLNLDNYADIVRTPPKGMSPRGGRYQKKIDALRKKELKAQIKSPTGLKATDLITPNSTTQTSITQKIQQHQLLCIHLKMLTAAEETLRSADCNLPIDYGFLSKIMNFLNKQLRRFVIQDDRVGVEFLATILYNLYSFNDVFFKFLHRNKDSRQLEKNFFLKYK